MVVGVVLGLDVAVDDGPGGGAVQEDGHGGGLAADRLEWVGWWVSLGLGLGGWVGLGREVWTGGGRPPLSSSLYFA